jgi:hypothetical protein
MNQSPGRRFTTRFLPTGERRAKAAGTNARYIDDADKLAAVCPKLAECVLAGEITLPEATALPKRTP